MQDLKPDDLKALIRENFLEYSSYVIRERAIPLVLDGLKPVHRRILYTLSKVHDGKLHKVANIVGQTMMCHPHGDQAIFDALVTLANKGYLLDRQGNFGNPITGDPASAARYIETRLSSLALETMFNPDLTEFVPTYDSRGKEPVYLPAKIPYLLLHGAEGIAVGMATKILPHNFNEVLEAEIALMEGKEIELLPDFPCGGIVDASDYRDGRGKVRVRAKIDVVDDKTVVIRENCYGSTTESLVNSIDEAAKKGKIRLESINDFTAEHVEIELKLPRGQHAKDLLPQLYAFTECELSISPQFLGIENKQPTELTITRVLEDHSQVLKDYLKRELEMEKDRLLQKIFERTLEQIFIENRLYKKIESIKTYDGVHKTISESLEPFHDELSRVPTKEDRERLLSIPIRRISKFDIEKNREEIAKALAALEQIEKNLRNLKRFTINYLKGLIKKFGKDYPRRTEIASFETVDVRKVAAKTVKVGIDLESSYIGTKVSSEQQLECSNLEKLLVLFQDGAYTVINVPEKEYIGHHGSKIAYCGIADKKTIFRAVYRDPKSEFCYAKRFIVKQFILERQYRFFEEGMNLSFLTTKDEQSLEISFKPHARQKVKKIVYPLDDVAVKGVSAKGIRIANKKTKPKVKVVEK